MRHLDRVDVPQLDLVPSRPVRIRSGGNSQRTRAKGSCA